MKIAFLSSFSKEYSIVADVTLPDKDKYCIRHGYDHVIQMGNYQELKDYYAFARLRQVYDLLFQSNYDAIFVANVHTLIMNHTRRLEEFMDKFHDAYFTKDVSGINAGVFLVKRTEWTHKWLNYILGYGDRHLTLPQYEQTIIAQTAEMDEFKQRLAVLPQNTFNSYLYQHYNWSKETPGQFQSGDFLIHVPGKSTIVGVNKSLAESRAIIFSSPDIQSQIIY